MNDADTFAEHRGMLFGIAYRMLGSVQDAEDVVQEAFVRWQQTDSDSIENPRAFLSTIATRLSIDSLRSAKRKRETYVGEWLPDPLISDAPTPDQALELSESLSTAFLLMLERLNPVERAAFLLHEVFDYPYRDVAEIIDKTEANCRQIVKRAKERVRAPQARFETPEEEYTRLLETFLTATTSGDVESLTAVLAEDATFHSDHGGKVIANKRILHGAAKIARFMVGIATRFPVEDLQVRVALINGKPGVIAYSGDAPFSAFRLEVEDGRITTVYATRNPDKLAHLPTPDSLN